MSETNPWAWYSDPAVLGLERERIFRSAWHYVCHAGRLAERSSYFASETGGLPALVVRDQDGELRAFLNVCRHRGAVVATGEGRRETLQCPYHAWTYGLDGRLRSAPRSDEAELGDIRLLPLRLEAWGPFLFVNADPDAEPLSIDVELPFDPAELVFHTRQDYVLEANWKIAVEHYLECYHCPVAHPGFTKLVDVAPDTYRLEANGRVWSQFGEARAGAGRCEFHLVWPTLKINVYPGFANLSIGPVWPESPERTVGFLDYFFGADVPEQDARELFEFDDQVGREDTALVESVQRGVRSGLLEHGRLLPASEQLIEEFQRKVAASLT
ncbi:MAG TPA: aromatic ring-hydroxylating dioxygenase subunit alpha [Gemmatimonadales bacterium]|nr:aromatic ring-hydroxylating dioxygenase subunit alpha [Gemmatimonadales bacterium]